MGGFELTQIEPLFRQWVALFMNPSSNLPAALALYGIIVLVVLIVLVAAIAVIMGTPEDEEYDYAPSTADVAGQAVRVESAERQERSAAVVTFPVTLVLLAVIWLVGGYTSAPADVCRGCHVKTVHDAAGRDVDKHDGQDCVSCHEAQPGIARYTTAVPARVLHYIDGVARTRLLPRYGTVAGSACLGCHESVRTGVTLDKKTGVRMSHAEPLRASATCLDCHKLQDGALTVRTVGMNPCLRCHDAKTASAECKTCHDGKTSAAARARLVQEPRELVVQVKCGGCHQQEVECDTCHGSRMPHSTIFKMYAHARAAAVDFWYNGGQTCGKCHTPTRRPCTKCHGSLLGRGHPVSNAQTHKLVSPVAGSGACSGCHQTWARSKERDFCRDVCHAPEEIKESPR